MLLFLFGKEERFHPWISLNPKLIVEIDTSNFPEWKVTQLPEEFVQLISHDFFHRAFEDHMLNPDIRSGQAIDLEAAGINLDGLHNHFVASPEQIATYQESDSARNG